MDRSSPIWDIDITEVGGIMSALNAEKKLDS